MCNLLVVTKFSKLGDVCLVPLYCYLEKVKTWFGITEGHLINPLTKAKAINNSLLSFQSVTVFYHSFLSTTLDTELLYLSAGVSVKCS